MCQYQPYCRHSIGTANSEPFRFEGQHLVSASFTFLYPHLLLQLSDADLELAANELQQTYSSALRPNFVIEVWSFKREFCKEVGKKTVQHTETHNKLSPHVIRPRIGYCLSRVYCWSLSQLAVAS